MAKKNETKLEVEDVKAYVEAQLLAQQINWRVHREAGDPISAALAKAEQAVMDKLYEFANAFWGAEIPAPGQGYDPPEAEYAEYKRELELQRIDEQVNELLRQRQAVIDGMSGKQPAPEPQRPANLPLATAGRAEPGTVQALGSESEANDEG